VSPAWPALERRLEGRASTIASPGAGGGHRAFVWSGPRLCSFLPISGSVFKFLLASL
jgi:hypothetical protein